jgi:glycine/D-amino acid oxidase-like deaminating enzyme
VLPRLAQGAPLPTALAVDVLLNPRLVAAARRIVVVGGGDVGCETAHMLAFELGKAVAVVEQADTFMTGSCTADRGCLLRALARQGTRLLPAARATALRRACVAQQAAEEIHGIGDCFRMGRIFDATKAAHATASVL